ncbi:MAG: nucleotidyltransferase domain-containing protein [Firmicutes bacterium]|nr:nucleotidyltransferase domain-containing protein [Bacillota bacterium]
MDKSRALKVAKKYSELVGERFKPKKIFLYGSYARDNWHKNSDIDIAVVVDTIDGDYLEMASALYRLRRDVDDRIEPVLLEEKEDPSGFTEEIFKHGQIIYKNTK